ncbi:hypothetical protein C6A85_000000106245 [Mycobacterium sp. ITM-2017-0098]|nr:hypothetical protein C6A85_000000106245 [Mycobacterium sp. ITM-2017-0098]
MVMAVTSFAQACRRHLRALGVNPLIRVSDRLEALVVLAVLATAIVAVPAAALAGNLMYDVGARTAIEQAQSRHSVDATVVVSSAALPVDFDNPNYVRAQWREGTQERTEQVVTPGTANVGDSVKVWLDDAGKVVAAPQTTEDARLSAIIAAVSVWTTIIAGAALAAFFIRRTLDGSRERGWDRELRLLAYNDDGWANRHI